MIQIQRNGHAWNQVKIGEEWFNADLTWDRDEIAERVERGERIGPEVLKNDEQFKTHERYSKSRTNSEEKCNVNIDELIPNYTQERRNLTPEIQETETLITDEPTVPTTPSVESIPEALRTEEIQTVEMSIPETSVSRVPTPEIVAPDVQKQDIVANQTNQNEFQNVPQDLGAQVQNLLQANSVTTAEFKNQYQQLQQMQQMHQLQQTQQIQQTQGMEIGM